MAVRASWSMDTNRLTIHKGAHTPGVPQRWTITISIEGQEVKDKWLIRPSHKITLNDIHDLVLEEIQQFSKNHGPLKKLKWECISR